MIPNPLYPSLTRISDLETASYEINEVDRAEWDTGDFVVTEVTSNGIGSARIELPNGRTVAVFPGYRVVGAFGRRFATLELTGSWEAIQPDGRVDILSACGLVGRLTSGSAYVTQPIEAKYVGHVVRRGKKVTMRGSVTPPPRLELKTPIVLIIGTSMSAGKTTAARVVVRQLRELGCEVVGAKLTGCGRYRDVLSMKDAGAQHILDFVDVGLPSTVVPEPDFREAAGELLARIAAFGADVAVIEAGASPLEPYNGGVAVELIQRNIALTIVAASDPYAVLGLQEAFGHKADLVTGPTANTMAGAQLVDRLTGVPTLNFSAPAAAEELRNLLAERFSD